MVSWAYLQPSFCTHYLVQQLCELVHLKSGYRSKLEMGLTYPRLTLGEVILQHGSWWSLPPWTESWVTPQFCYVTNSMKQKATVYFFFLWLDYKAVPSLSSVLPVFLSLHLPRRESHCEPAHGKIYKVRTWRLRSMVVWEHLPSWNYTLQPQPSAKQFWLIA